MKPPTTSLGSPLCRPTPVPGIRSLRDCLSELERPSYVVDMGKLEQNLNLLGRIQQQSGGKILLAMKSFSMWKIFGHMSEFLAGAAASGLWEARLGHDHFPGEIHTYSPGFGADEIEDIFDYSDHVIFNSVNQWNRFAAQARCRNDVDAGLRINPQFSTGAAAIYNPCRPGSRLGIPAAQFEGLDLTGINGFHCHTLCQQGVDDLAATLKVVEERYAKWLPQLKWFNMGGGHDITKPGYDVDRLIQLIRDFQARYDLQVYLEPGEAVVLRTGVLCSRVLDVLHNDVDLAILDVSATSHMPDVLEMPYRPNIYDAGLPNEKAHTFRLGGPSCLSGDIIGDYSFDKPLEVGDQIVFDDMSQYTMVKSTFFNGVRHPAIAIYDPNHGEIQTLREFQYEDFRDRLA